MYIPPVVGGIFGGLFISAHDWRSSNVDLEPVLLHGMQIERVSKFKYLGVEIDSNLNFKHHYNVVERKLNCALAKMYAIRRLLSINVMKTFLSAYVVSTADYAQKIWCVQSDRDVMHLQRKIDRFLSAYFLSKNCISKKDVRKHQYERYSSVNPIKYLEKLDLLTILESKKLSLIKFIIKNRNRKLCKGWFVNSNRGCSGRINLPKKPNSELFKQSVMWSSIEVWNHCVQKLKITDVDEVGYDSFINECKKLLVLDGARFYI